MPRRNSQTAEPAVDPAADTASSEIRAPPTTATTPDPSPHYARLEGGTFLHYRQNLTSLDQARARQQFALGVGDVALEDFDHPGSHAAATQAPGDEVKLLRPDWGDGSSVDLAALLDAASQDVDGAEYGPLLEDSQASGGAGSSRGASAEWLRRAELRRKRQRRYAESATGTFRRWKAKSLSLAVGHGGSSLGGHGSSSSSSSSLSRGTRPKKGSSEAYEAYAAWVHGLLPVERAGWLFAQGLLAGFSSAPLILQWTASSDQAFVISYRRYCNESRQLLFVLAITSALGTIDSLAQALVPPKSHAGLHAHSSSYAGHRNSSGSGAPRERKWKERGIEERLELVLVAVLYLIAFVSTVICSVGDAVMYRKNGYGEKKTKNAFYDIAEESFGGSEEIPDNFLTWDNYALNTELGDGVKFQELLEQWYAANVTRFVCALCGWCVVVRLHYLATSITAAQAERPSALMQMEQRLFELQAKAGRLAGHSRALEGLSRPELKRLLAQQRWAVDATAARLGQKQQQPNSGFAMV